MITIDKVAENLFDKIRARFNKVVIRDEKRKKTLDPTKARFFSFKFSAPDEDNIVVDYGSITISLVDSQSLKIFYDMEIEKDMSDAVRQHWYKFLQSMRKFAKRNMVDSFDVRDISKAGLELKDLKHLNKDADVFDSDEALSESMQGVTKTSPKKHYFIYEQESMLNPWGSSREEYEQEREAETAAFQSKLDQHLNNIQSSQASQTASFYDRPKQEPNRDTDSGEKQQSAGSDDQDDFVAPHGDAKQELELFASGKKPAAIVNAPHFSLWKRLIDTGRYVLRPLIGEGGEKTGFVIGQPGEDERVSKIQSLVQNATNAGLKGDFRPYQNSNYHRWLGRLLGYPAEAIERFITNYFRDKEDLAKERIDEQNISTDRSMPKPGDTLQWSTMQDRTTKTGTVASVQNGVAQVRVGLGANIKGFKLQNVPLMAKNVSWKTIPASAQGVAEGWKENLAALGIAGALGAAGPSADAATNAPQYVSQNAIPIIATITIEGEKRQLDLTSKGFTDVRQAEKFINQFLYDRGIMNWQGIIERGTKGSGNYQKITIHGAGGLQESRNPMTGTSRSSYQVLETAKIIVRHSKRIEENDDPRSRSRNIAAIFIQNESGERFRMPQGTTVNEARIIARHVRNEGTIYDDFGNHLMGMLNEMHQLKQFTRNMRGRTFEDQTTQAMLESAQDHYGELHSGFFGMRTQRGYERFREGWEPDEGIIMDEIDLDEMRKRFEKRYFDERLEEALPVIARAHKYRKTKMEEEFGAWMESVIEKSFDKMIKEDIDPTAPQDSSSPLSTAGQNQIGIDSMSQTKTIIDSEKGGRSINKFFQDHNFNVHFQDGKWHFTSEEELNRALDWAAKDGVNLDKDDLKVAEYDPQPFGSSMNDQSFRNDVAMESMLRLAGLKK